MVKVFLSHSSEDKTFALKLANDLRSKGIEVRIGDEVVRVGEPLIRKLTHEIERADFFIVVLSEASVSSDWVTLELDVGMLMELDLKNPGKILPVKLKNCDTPGFLRGRKFADFRNTADYNDSLNQLLQAMERSFDNRKKVTEIVKSDVKFEVEEIGKIIKTNIQKEIRPVIDEIGDVVREVLGYWKLISPQYISMEERIAKRDIWVVTKNLNNDLDNENFRESVKLNLSLKKCYTYFIPNTEYMKRRVDEYNEIYREWAGRYKFAELSHDMLLPFDEIVIYDPHDPKHSWGYFQIQYPDGTDLFAFLSKPYLVDIIRFLDSIKIE